MDTVHGIWNWKGGVTKTSSTLNIASHLTADHGLRVVAVDFDPQSTLTRLAGLDPGALEPSQTVLGALLPEEYGAIDARDLLREAPGAGTCCRPPLTWRARSRCSPSCQSLTVAYVGRLRRSVRRPMWC